MQVVGVEVSGNGKIVTARELGLVSCQRCTKVWPLGTMRCTRCGATVVSRDTLSLQRVWAWWIVGLMCYLPANLYPMLRTNTLLSSEANTIVGGVIELIHYDSYGIALVIFLASVMIPVGKFLAIAFLAISAQRGARSPSHHRMGLYEVVEYIGRWSMIDVFVVAILSALVQLNTLASIEPGVAALFFGLSVIFTMLSAQSFDARLIWDAERQ